MDRQVSLPSYNSAHAHCFNFGALAHVKCNVNVREFLGRLRNDRYFKVALANRKETHVG